MKIQINIQQLDNGFLVAHPPLQPVIQRHQQQEVQPTVHFCKDKAEVKGYLDEIWPVEG